MVSRLPNTRRGVRNRAMLLLGFAGVFRRSDVDALDLKDVKFNDEGMVVAVRGSKTDQERAGVKIGIPYGGSDRTCPVKAVKARGKTSGYEYRKRSYPGKKAQRIAIDTQ